MAMKVFSIFRGQFQVSVVYEGMKSDDKEAEMARSKVKLIRWIHIEVENNVLMLRLW